MAVVKFLGLEYGLRPRAVLKTSSTDFPNLGPPGRQITYRYLICTSFVAQGFHRVHAIC